MKQTKHRSVVSVVLVLTFTVITCCLSLGQMQRAISDSQTALIAAGSTLTFNDGLGTSGTTVEVLILGTAPATISVVTKGCGRGGTCSSALNTYTSVANTLLNLAPTQPYDNYQVIISWTGGDATTKVQINRVSAVAKYGGVVNGTINTIPKFTASSTIGNSALSDNGTNVISSEAVLFPDGSLSLPSLSFSAESSTGFYRKTSAETQYSGLGTAWISLGQRGGGSVGSLLMRSTGVMGFAGTGNGLDSAADTCYSRLAAGSFGFGTCTSGDVSGTLSAAAINVNGVPVAGGFTCVNVTPVTVSVNTAADQNLMACTIPAGTLNILKKTLLIQLAGVYSTPAGSTSTINLKAKLCTVSGCGSGTVVTLASITSAALGTIQVTNDPFNMTVNSSTQTTGGFSAFESHGNLVIDTSLLTTAAEGIYADNNTATVGPIDTTLQLFLQITVAFLNASASNSATQRQLITDTVD